jgi:hypothetical protein
MEFVEMAGADLRCGAGGDFQLAHPMILWIETISLRGIRGRAWKLIIQFPSGNRWCPIGSFQMDTI